ncbi:alpha/beta hydrolase family protein [Alloscardovia venturai]|uniref:Alpha/beta hydrolase family protein n=1 Tax=Alloscardovia venturai TaxID=1769421 RepID=A0ABW2Y4T0_9BIFI
MHKKVRASIILLVALSLVVGGGYAALRTINPGLFVPQTQATITKTSELKKADKTQQVTEEVHVSHDGIDLYGKLVAPANYKKVKLPLFIMAHGYDSNADFIDAAANLVASKGYMIYSFDFYGGSTSTRSGDTDMLDMSVETEKKDLEAVINYWKSQKFVDSSHIYLGGVSHGGLISAMAAADLPRDITAMILFAPAFNVPDLAHSGFSHYGYTDISQVPASVSYEGKTVGKRYIADALNLNIPAIQRAYDGPVLIIHGTVDDAVPFSYSESASHTYKNAQLIPIKGAGHTANISTALSALPDLDLFLKKY